MKNNILKNLQMSTLVCLAIVSILLLLRYQKVHYLESVYTKEELFKLCREGKVNIYGCVSGGAW